MSDTTVRERRDEWIEAGVFDKIAAEAIGGYDRIIGLALGDVAVAVTYPLSLELYLYLCICAYICYD